MQVEETRKMVDTAIEDLANALERGRSDTLKAYLAAMGRFHRYSLGNAILIALGRPGATRVAGFRTWQKLGRQVRKGERGTAILAPIVRRPGKRRGSPHEQPLVQEVDQERVVAFRTAYVFDVSQTDGRELAAFATVGGSPGEVLESLRVFVRESGIDVRYAPHLRGAEGLSAGGSIILREGLTPAEEFSTVVHELAHERLHHDGVERSKVVKETEAEAVAYAVCVAAGLDTNTASRDYMHLYDGKKETLMASLERIRSVAVEIIGAIMRNPPADAAKCSEGVSSEISVAGKAAA